MSSFIPVSPEGQCFALFNNYPAYKCIDQGTYQPSEDYGNMYTAF